MFIFLQILKLNRKGSTPGVGGILTSKLTSVLPGALQAFSACREGPACLVGTAVCAYWRMVKGWSVWEAEDLSPQGSQFMEPWSGVQDIGCHSPLSPLSLLPSLSPISGP